MKVELVTITPEMAAKMLERNTGNFRKMDRRRVDLYASEIDDNKWHLNGEAIKINVEDMILDGQHRLAAIVKAGKPITTLVISELEVDGRTLDRGKPRSIGQWCEHMGLRHATCVASVARMSIIYDLGLWGKRYAGASTYIQDSAIFAYIETYAAELQKACTVANGLRGFPRTLITAVLHIGCNQKDPESFPTAMWFVEKLKTGVGLTDMDAVLHYRNRILSKSKSEYLDDMYKRALTTMTWNKTVKGESCSKDAMRLRLTGPTAQQYPSVIERLSLVDSELLLSLRG